jgi:hypothetical protein
MECPVELEGKKMAGNEIRLQAFIISWTGRHENALQIYREINDFCNVTIIYSDEDENNSFQSEVRAIRRPNNLMFGDKFLTALNVFSGDIFLLIHADCFCSSWLNLLQTCINDFNERPDIAVWSPVIENSWPPLELSEIMQIPDSSLSIVSNTDSIVFAINRGGVARLKVCDYEQNVHGWWAHVPAIVSSMSRGEIVVINREINVKHARGRGYNSLIAHDEGSKFLDNLSIQEKSIWILLHYHYEDSHRDHTSKSINGRIRRILNRLFFRTRRAPQRPD